ncbi:hypothetical protein CARUB_v10007215mg [Capsella rubella]|uniref:Neprosin PEP catalytic domain-containing protein n=1 Tax=Capsella rubella TaxID=81985 RepID=R0FAA4_9BRAS|nr:hypothetical protein CARUB_v10007215mg [Capsella rubella]
MDIFVSFVVFILLVLSSESAKHMKSIKMKPTGWDSQPKNKFVDTQHKNNNNNNIQCPIGTVPILRTKKEHVMQSQEYPINQFTTLTAQYPGTHIAGMKIDGPRNHLGMEAGLWTYNVSIGKNQSSSAIAYVASRSKYDGNSIQVGWMINEKLFGDTRPWRYGSWLGILGSGCMNLQCPGFVQVAYDDPMNKPLNVTDGRSHLLWLTIHQDKETKDWWFSQTNPDQLSQKHLGYWPKELFNLFRYGANFVGFGGIVTGDPRSPSPPMGNGHLPNKHDRLASGSLDHLTTIDMDDTHAGFNEFMAVPLVDSKVCYDVHYVGYVDEDVGIAVSYGGPGGIKCGD